MEPEPSSRPRSFGGCRRSSISSPSPPPPVPVPVRLQVSSPVMVLDSVAGPVVPLLLPLLAGELPSTTFALKLGAVTFLVASFCTSWIIPSSCRA